MTSSVKFHASCMPTKELIVAVNYPSQDKLNKYVLNDGESMEVHLYDDISVLSYEQEKEIK